MFLHHFLSPDIDLLRYVIQLPSPWFTVCHFYRAYFRLVLSVHLSHCFIVERDQQTPFSVVQCPYCKSENLFQ